MKLGYHFSSRLTNAFRAVFVGSTNVFSVRMRSTSVSLLHGAIIADNPADSASPLPLILLDIDGVLNGAAYSWPEDTRKKLDPMTVGLRYSTAVIDQINKWSRTKAAEIKWSTFWGSHAQTDLAPALKLDHFELATKNPEDCGELKRESFFNAVKDNPTRKVVWIDDELFSMMHRVWEKYEDVVLRKNILESGSVLLVNPYYIEGLKQQHLTMVDLFLKNKLTREEVAKNNQVVGINLWLNGYV